MLRIVAQKQCKTFIRLTSNNTQKMYLSLEMVFLKVKEEL